MQSAPVMARILLIDDDPVVGSANQAALSEAGHDVSLVSSAAEGLATALRWVPEAVVCEAYFEQDGGGAAAGMQLCRELERSLPRVPVIVLSRLDERLDPVERRRQDRDGGWIAADLYLQKPLAPALLIEQVAHVLPAGH